MNSGQLSKFLIPAILLFGILIYLPSVQVRLLNDEIAFIERTLPDNFNDYISLLDKKEYDLHYYRPLGNLAAGSAGYFFGYNYYLYRIFNLLLHSLNGLLVFIFIRRITQLHRSSDFIAFFAALFFLSIPLHDYAVIWHTDLFDRLLLPFYLLSVIYFLKSQKPGILSLIFFTASLLTKEMAFSLPLIIIIIDIFIHRVNSISKILLNSAPYFLTAGVLIILRIIIFDNNILTAQDAHAGYGLISIIKNYLFMGGLLVFPFFIREAEFILKNNLLIAAFTGTFLAIVFLVFIILKRRKDYIFLFLLLFVLITFLPASRLLMRWYLYLPSVGFAAFLSYVIFSVKFNFRAMILTASLITLLYSSYLLYREVRWVNVSEAGYNSILQLKQDYQQEISSNSRVSFYTIPAKVDDIPLFQLGFNHHLRYFLGEDKGYDVISKSTLDSFEDNIHHTVTDSAVLLVHSGYNYLLLTNGQKNVKFEPYKVFNGKIKEIEFEHSKEPGRIFFTFSHGKFFLIEE